VPVETPDTTSFLRDALCGCAVLFEKSLLFKAVLFKAVPFKAVLFKAVLFQGPVVPSP
jgi:hypothetical protein